jgi:hypothetical protein
MEESPGIVSDYQGLICIERKAPGAELRELGMKYFYQKCINL